MMYCRRCRYVLDSLSDHRCPECGRPFDPANRRTYRTTPHRKSAYLGWGFLIGSGIMALLTLLHLMPGYFANDSSGTSKAIAEIILMLGLAIAVGTGLIGMLFGYGIYRWRCRTC